MTFYVCKSGYNDSTEAIYMTSILTCSVRYVKYDLNDQVLSRLAAQSRFLYELGGASAFAVQIFLKAPGGLVVR
jgi:hypothetical protein